MRKIYIDHADNFICVLWDETMYRTGEAYPGYVEFGGPPHIYPSTWIFATEDGLFSFDPRPSDLLVAMIDFAAGAGGVVNMSTGVNANLGETPDTPNRTFIHMGFDGSDLQVAPDRWGGNDLRQYGAEWVDGWTAVEFTRRLQTDSADDFILQPDATVDF